jgi:hypothetical protein
MDLSLYNEILRYRLQRQAWFSIDDNKMNYLHFSKTKYTEISFMTKNILPKFE